MKVIIKIPPPSLILSSLYYLLEEARINFAHSFEWLFRWGFYAFIYVMVFFVEPIELVILNCNVWLVLKLRKTLLVRVESEIYPPEEPRIHMQYIVFK